MTALALTLAALGLLAVSLRRQAVVASFAAALAAVAGAASTVPERAAPGSLAIAVALAATSVGLLVVGQLVWRALDDDE